MKNPDKSVCSTSTILPFQFQNLEVFCEMVFTFVIVERSNDSAYLSLNSQYRANAGGSLKHCSTVEETGCQVRCAHCAIIAVIIIKTPATSYVKTMICSAYFFKPLTLSAAMPVNYPQKQMANNYSSTQFKICMLPPLPVQAYNEAKNHYCRR